MTDNRYDVIIIGTGAGGGTLAYHLAPSGKRILILERGDYVPREKANWDPQVVNVDAHYNAKESWLDKDGKDLHPHTNYNVGGNTKFMVLLCSACAKRISENCAITAASRSRGRSVMTISSRTTRRPKISIRCTETGEKIRLSRRLTRPIHGPPSAMSRASSNYPTTSHVRA